MERRTEVRPRDFAPADNDLASVEAVQLFLREPDAVCLAVNAHEHPGSCDTCKLVEPAALDFDGQVGEDRERVDEVERLVGVGKRRLGPVDLERAEGEVLAAPADERRVEVGSVDLGGEFPPPANDPAAPAAAIQDRAHRLERLRDGVPDRLRRRPSAGEKPLGAGNPGDHQPKSRGWQRQPVVGRPAAAAHRTERLVRAVRREQQAEPVQQREQTPFHSRGESIRAAVGSADEGYTQPMAKAPALPSGFELPLEPRLPRIGSIDQVAVEERAASLARRSIKREAKLFALDLAVRMMDLTTLEGADTPGKVSALCSKAIRPDPVDASVPSVAAVCVYPNLVPTAVARLRDSTVKVASVATAFPSGQSPLSIKLADVREAVELGADEIDMVIDRGAFLSGRYAKVYDEIVKVKEACGDAHLKVILETGELETYDNVRRASVLAMAAGADFIKTSTGKVNPASTLPGSLVMMEAIRDFHAQTGRPV